jgi:hypothetical protein
VAEPGVQSHQRPDGFAIVVPVPRMMVFDLGLVLPSRLIWMLAAVLVLVIAVQASLLAHE